MQDYQIPTPATTAADWQAWFDYANDMHRFPHDPRTPCANPDCSALCESLYCCEGCRIVVEGDTPDEEDYYQADGVLLGEKALADAQRAADGENLAALVCGPATPATPAPLPEAPASVNCYITMAGGHQVQVTLRGVDEAAVLARLETLLQRFPVAPPAASAPVHGENWCPIHQVTMQLNHGKDGSTWHSHKTAQGWCKGKGVRHG